MRFVDYIAAGQDRGSLAVFLTLMATMLGASATLGVAAKAEAIGFPAIWWLASGSIGLALQGVLLAGRIRETGARTLPELAGKVAGTPARRLVAGVIAVAWPGVVGAQFAAAGSLVGALAGADASAAWPVPACAAAVILYTLLGGQRAVVRSDAIQMAVLALGFGGLFAWVFGGKCGGARVPWGEVRWVSDAFGWREAALSVLTVGGAYFLGPDIASRSLLARDGRAARRAVLWASPALLAFAVGVVLAGMWAGANAPGPGNPLHRLAALLPWGLRWCLSAGLVAALLSSADTCLVNAGAIAANDLLGRGSVGAARAAVAAVGAAATALAIAGGDIIGILLKAYSVYTPGVVCPLAVAIVAGGMRGLFTAGVLDALYAEGIRFPGIIAVSAGAAFGCNFKSGQPGRALRYNVRYCRDARYWGLASLLRTGDLFNADFCYRAIPRELDPWDAAAFEADPARFWVVATDADTAESACTEIVRADGLACEWIRASASMPGVSRPVPIDGRRWLDGGISDAIPLARFQAMGYRRCVVVLTRPAGYRKRSTRLAALLARAALRRLPAIAEAMVSRPARYNRALDHVAAEEARGNAFVIRPPCALPVGRTTRSPDALRRTHALGLEAARSALPALRDWLAAST